MNVQSLTKGLKYKGEAEGKRQTYYIFEGSGYFSVISFKKDNPTSGNFNVVDSEAVQYVQRKFAGLSGMTAQDVFNDSSKTRHFVRDLDALNALYVLVGLKRAKVDKRFKSKSLYFNVK